MSFPLLSEPSRIFGLLSGQDVDLFALELPTFVYDVNFSQFFPIPAFPIVGAQVSASIAAQVDLAFGFDTVGINQFRSSGNPLDVFNGFYVFDHENADGSGADISELIFQANVTAGVGLNAALVRASVDGGLFGRIDFNLHDNNEDGRVRAVELLDNALLGPIHIFDVSGAVDARLIASADVGLPPAAIHFQADIVPPFRVLDFQIPRPTTEAVPLAQKNGSVLELNIGPLAVRRNFFFTEDIAESYVLRPGQTPGSVIVEAFGRSQLYQGVTAISGDAGLGNDRIEVSPDLNIPIFLSGGQGDDVLIGGAGNDILSGGAGNDQLFGNGGQDTLYGAAGNDVIRGGSGADFASGGSGLDTLFGGDGDDELWGDADRDQLYGDAGEDQMFGGSGDDLLEGGTGSDRIEGGSGNDRIDGGKDGDLLWGDAGDDQLRGGDGSDEIHGGLGQDFVSGGLGNDEIFGDDGDDQLYGENSRDTIYGGRGNDRLFGGLAEDTLFGGLGNDVIYASDDLLTPEEANHTIHGGGGQDTIYGADGNDVVFGDGINDAAGFVDAREDGADVIQSLAGDDQVFGGGGNDTIWAGAGNDYVSGDLGNDFLQGGTGDDVLWGGFAAIALSRLDRSTPAAIAANFVLPPRWDEVQGRAETATGYVPTRLVTPAALNGLSSEGSPSDGQDTLQGDDGSDLLFGGSEADAIDGGDGDDYVDAGLGNDLDVTGGRGDDVVRGGGGNDAVRGGDGIDQVYGDSGDDLLFGDAGRGLDQTGQRLFGGDGRDTLFAYAPTTIAEAASGDQLLGDAGGDTLYGNTRQDILLGGEGNDLLSGDYLAGPLYVPNGSETNGASDLLLGDAGEDRLVGNGGDDQLWGGAGTDVLDGAAGADTAFGGGGVDLFVLYTGPGAASDILDGHGPNALGDGNGTTADDNATDILVINGTGLNDTILLSETDTQQRRLRVDLNGAAFFVDWRSPLNDAPLVEQFQLNGFGGDDNLGFAQTHVLPGMNRGGPMTFALPGGAKEVDLTTLSARGRDFVAVINGGDGDDRLVGGTGRDRLDGNAGSDRLFGLVGDDRLWGDSGDGSRFDRDELFAGGGNDDLLGGQGRNDLYAWSFSPDIGANGLPRDPAEIAASGPSSDFGVFLDSQGRPVASPALGGVELENTGLNRLVGQVRDDYLLGGTGVDFMYGGGGGDTLLRRDGQTFVSLDENLAGEAWKQYAEDTGQVWYVGGTNADDRINVDFVTEPGLLADHHLITRLTNNNGTYSFDASVRLDFAATDANGTRLWDANDLVFRANDYLSAMQADPNDGQAATSLALTALTDGLLPPEDEYLAIIIDALDGDDEITVGPTVQKTVWIDAGDGDDRVEIVSGNAILIDRAEIGTPQGGLRGRNDTAAQAFDLDIEGPNSDGVILTNLTIDNPNDTDWFRFTPQLSLSQASIRVAGNSPDDNLMISIYAEEDYNGNNSPPLIGPSTGPLDLGSLVLGETYLLRVESDLRPTIYDLQFQRGVAGPLPIINMALRDDPVRRDVILGGRGNDILIGGPGEDWIFGGPREVAPGVEDRDVLSGGVDRQASDLLFGGADHDSFQILPDFLPQLSNQRGTLFDPTGQTYIPTTSDQFFGGEGDDQVIFAGGDRDRDGRVVPDFVALRYNTGLHRYEFTNLVWDVDQLAFATEMTDTSSLVYQQQYLFYQTRDIERTVLTTADGDDVVHLDGTFKLLPISGTVNPADIDTWGIDVGDAQQSTSQMSFTVQAGDGDDRVFGSPLADVLRGGAGNDQLVGGGGDDEIDGGGGNDQLYGGTTDLVDGNPVNAASGSSDPSDLFRFAAAPPLLITPPPSRLGIDLQQTTDASFDQSAAFEGSLANEGLEAAQSIGDFNGDGRDDMLLSGQSFSYVILSTADLDNVVAVRDRAQFVIDHAALGRPAIRMGNMDGDDFADLIFQREVAGELIITVVRGGPNAGVNAQNNVIAWPRQWDGDFVSAVLSDNNHYQIQIPASQVSAADVRTYALHYLGDESASGNGHDDLLVVSSTPTPAGVNRAQYGFVFSGQALADRLLDGSVTAADAAATVVTLNPQAPSPPDYLEEDLQLVVAGDATGNGRDDVLVYDAKRQMAALIEGGTLGDVGVDAQSAVADPFLGNLVRPVAVGDLNQDGLDELALATAQQVSIYFGSPQPEAISFTNPDIRVTAPADHPGSTTLSVTGGDFNGDGEGDLAVDVGVTRLPDAVDDPQTYVFFGIAGQSQPLQFSDAAATISVPSGGLPIARALQFGGQASVVVNDDSSIAIQKQVTIEAWIRVDNLDTNLQAIVQKGNGEDSKNHAFALFVNEFGSLVADTSDGLTGNRVVSATQLIETGRWYHVAAVINRAAGVQRMRLFVNGRTAAMTSGGAISTPNDVRNTVDPLIIGGQFDPSDPPSPLISPFNGAIEEVRIWDTARTPGEIAANMNRRLSGTETGLAAYYRLEEAIGGLVIDRTMGQSHGQLMNAANAEFIDVFAKLGQLPAAPGIDLNADGFDELLIGSVGARSHDTQRLGVGRVSTIYGSGTLRLPGPQDTVIELANRTIPGSGSFVERRAAGTTATYPAVGARFALPAGSSEQWFRLATLGDGRGGDVIRLGRAGLATNTQLSPVAQGTVRGASVIDQTIQLDRIAGNTGVGVLEFDLSQFLDLLVGPSDLAAATLQLDLTEGQPESGFLFVDILDGESDSQLTTADGPSAARLSRQIISLQPGSGLYDIDFTSALLASFAAQRSRLTVRLQLADPNSDGPWLVNQARLQIERPSGLVADLISSGGNVLFASQAAIDLRSIPAGSYFLRIATDDGQPVAATREFQVEIAAPNAGQSFPISDRDVLRGGDGDDLLVGNEDFDYLFGESGTDAFIGENVEIHDYAVGDLVALDPPNGEQTSQAIFSAVDPVVEIPDSALRGAILRALGFPTEYGERPLRQ